MYWHALKSVLALIDNMCQYASFVLACIVAYNVSIWSVFACITIKYIPNTNAAHVNTELYVLKTYLVVFNTLLVCIEFIPPIHITKHIPKHANSKDVYWHVLCPDTVAVIIICTIH